MNKFRANKGGDETSSGSQAGPVPISDLLLLISHVTLDKLLLPSEPRFPICKMALIIIFTF